MPMVAMYRVKVSRTNYFAFIQQNSGIHLIDEKKFDLYSNFRVIEKKNKKKTFCVMILRVKKLMTVCVKKSLQFGVY